MKTFDEKHYFMTIHENGLIEFKVKKGISFTAEDVWLSRDQSVNYKPGRKFYVLMESEEEFNPTPDARRAGASKEYAQHVAALAFYSSNVVLKIVGNLFIKVSRPVVPTRFFDEREKAIEWLKKFMVPNQ
jgi:hypothetical protein